MTVTFKPITSNLLLELACLALGTLLVLLAAACAPRSAKAFPPIVVPPPPVVVLLVPGPLLHDLTAWRDDDTVCVDVPKVQALYLAQRCLSMATLRSVILTARIAE